MPCHPYKLGDGTVGFICTGGNVYHFEGFTFEDHRYCGPMKLRRDGEPAVRIGKKFWAAATRWAQLPKRKRETFRVKG